MSDIEKIKAAQAAHRSRRTRPPRPPTTSVLAPSTESADAPVNENTPADNTNTEEIGPQSDSANSDDVRSTESALVATLKKQHAQQVDALRQDISNLRVELSSLRRNHIENIKKISQERDMFASQLAAEQKNSERSKASSTDHKKISDLEVQLRASRTRNSDLEAENSTLRDEVKQLMFRVQAGRTIDAASDGYNKVVDELVEAKLKCAQLLEEKEDLLRINKELTTTSAVLHDANGELEKSRSKWVLRCAEMEKQRSELEGKLQDQPADENPTTNDATSYTGSDLQELKL